MIEQPKLEKYSGKVLSESTRAMIARIDKNISELKVKFPTGEYPPETQENIVRLGIAKAGIISGAMEIPIEFMLKADETGAKERLVVIMAEAIT